MAMMHTNRSEGDEIHITGPATIRIGKIGGARVLLSIDAPASTVITTTKAHEEETPYGHI
jgi:sRNA-binding carbon storage regulator CsrA